MIDRLKPYPTMKDSGVPWLGQVPEHWEVLPNRAFFDEVKERDHPEEPMLSVTITRGVIRQRELLADSSKKDNSNQDKSAYKLVRPGDIAYNKMRAWQGAIGVSYYHGIVSPAYVVERPRKGTSSRYLHYLLRTPAFAKEAERWSYGITSDMWSLRPEHFKMIYGCLPSLLDQTAIVRFLDHADRRIRRYIHAKQKLIALLEEQKQAIIYQAVTGKINVRTSQPYPAYKDSGVEWLGEVPKHWEVAQLRRFAVDRCDGPFGSGLKSSHYTEDGIRVVRLQNIGNGEFRDSDVAFISPDHYSTLGDHSVILGDILVAGLGDNNHPAGRACVAPENIGPAMVKADCFRFRPDKDQVEPHFVALQLTATASTASALLSTGATRQRTNLQSTSARAISIPAFHEQALVVEYTENATSGTRAAQETAIRGIACLREYRTRLIADVVTGKLDVRDAAATLPEVDPLAGDDVDDPEDPEVDSALEDLESRTEVII